MEKILIATANPGKYKEIKVTLDGLAECVFLKDLGVDLQFDEDGLTYEQNALKKALHFANLTGMKTLADDSGIEVEALKGELGVRTRRFGAGEGVSDEEWLKYFLVEMNNFPNKEQRRAKFVCAAALVGFGENKVFRGESSGVVTQTPEAPIKSGIPLSSCFLPDGFNKVYAALSDEEKGEISHRGMAMKQVRSFLSEFYE